MIAILSGSMAAFLAMICNRFLVNRWGNPAVAVLIPVTEEFLKTLLAVTFSASIFYTHFSFGVIEAIWDIRATTKGFLPALFSLITHSVFGLITMLFFKWTGYLFLSILISTITHIFWNSTIIRISQR